MRAIHLTSIFPAVAAALTTLPALARSGDIHSMGSFASGLLHPFGGLDHFAAMLALGIWSGQQRGRAAWLLPLLFPVMLVIGALLVKAGLVLPLVEGGILTTLALLGMLLAFALRLPLVAAAALVGLFALLHGQAHTLEMPAGASLLQYGAGFVMASCVLNVAGIALGRRGGNLVGRAVGIAITLCGIYMMAA